MDMEKFAIDKKEENAIEKIREMFSRAKKVNPDLATDVSVISEFLDNRDKESIALCGSIFGTILSNPSATKEDAEAVKLWYESTNNNMAYLITFEKNNFDKMPSDIKKIIFQDTIKRLEEELHDSTGTNVFIEYVCAELAMQLQDTDIKSIVEIPNSKEREQLYGIVQELCKENPYETIEDFKADFSIAEDVLSDGLGYYDCIDEFLYAVAQIEEKKEESHYLTENDMREIEAYGDSVEQDDFDIDI